MGSPTRSGITGLTGVGPTPRNGGRAGRGHPVVSPGVCGDRVDGDRPQVSAVLVAGAVRSGTIAELASPRPRGQGVPAPPCPRTGRGALDARPCSGVSTGTRGRRDGLDIPPFARTLE